MLYPLRDRLKISSKIEETEKSGLKIEIEEICQGTLNVVSVLNFHGIEVKSSGFKSDSMEFTS